MKKNFSLNNIKNHNFSIGRRIFHILDSIVDFTMLSLFLLMLASGFYAIWDSQQIMQKADSVTYKTYKPSENPKTFEELQKINPDVFGWLTVYGTHIDYPLLQSTDNSTYVNTDPEGNYSLSGSIFLDSRNQPDFSDFNNIIHGHHMAGNVMFGEIDLFEEEDFFNSHQYGSLYYDGQLHGIEFFAYLQADAYDETIYDLSSKDTAGQKEEYIKKITDSALHLRKCEISANDHIVLLSTCSTQGTNSRNLLAGVITPSPHQNPFPKG